jgi:predicted proteasome-type protease
MSWPYSKIIHKLLLISIANSCQKDLSVGQTLALLVWKQIENYARKSLFFHLFFV